MGKIRAYIIDTTNELKNKVTWPTSKELQSSAIIVMVASLLTAILIYLMDISFKFIMDMVYNFFS